MRSGQSVGFWLGDDASLQKYLEAQAHGLSGKSMLPERDVEEEDDEGYMRLIKVDDNVATISVKGSLSSEDNWMNSLFGITSYNEIRNAIVTAVEDPEVDVILLDIDSGGGHASGVAELAEFIVQARSYKPIHTYVSGTAFSAAYWIASATESISGPKMSEAGSIGVIAVVKTQEKRMKKEGISPTVFRGGKLKALGNGYEELTDEAKEVIQAKIDKMYGFFTEAIADNRRLSTDQDVWAEGRTFFAEDAIRVGLMDSVNTFDRVFAYLVKQGHNSNSYSMSEGIDVRKKVLTEAAIAAKAAGASDADVQALLEEEQIVTEAEAEAEAAPAEEGEAEAETPEEDAKATDTEAEGKAAAAEDTLVSYLKAETKTLQLSNAKLEAKVAKLEEDAAEYQANESALKSVVGTFMSQMCVPLGMSAPTAVESADTNTVLAQYKSIRRSFTSTFKVGASAEIEDGESEESQAGEAVSLYEQAALKANKF